MGAMVTVPYFTWLDHPVCVINTFLLGIEVNLNMNVLFRVHRYFFYIKVTFYLLIFNNQGPKLYIALFRLKKFKF